jgi:AcrR family transcriptional regulator
VSDQAVLAGAARAIARLGPSALTLAEIGFEVGLAPATLVQRFGSKRGLLLALVADAAGATRRELAELRAAHPSPLAALYAYAERFAAMAEAPAALAHHLAFLQLDLTDPEFRAHALAQARVARAGLRALLDDARAAGELADVDTRVLARTVQTTLGGSLLTWGLAQQGAAVRWVRADLDAVLAPHRRAAAEHGDTRARAPRR